jgi:hypothetical protein
VTSTHSSMECEHRETRRPTRPVPDWTGTCPACGERVKHDGRGGFVTVREVNDRLAERRVLREAASDVILDLQGQRDRLYAALVSIQDRPIADIAFDPRWPRSIARQALDTIEEGYGRG